MESMELPIGELLNGVSIIENTNHDSAEISLTQVKLYFQKKAIILQVVTETDEIDIVVEPLDDSYRVNNTPKWCTEYINKMLQSVWICENNQKYQDQVIFAFEYITPSLSFVAEGSAMSVLKLEKV